MTIKLNVVKHILITKQNKTFKNQNYVRHHVLNNHANVRCNRGAKNSSEQLLFKEETSIAPSAKI